MCAPDLTKVAVLLKTFLRDGHLFEAVAGLRAMMPEVQLIVADDGDPSPVKDGLYKKLRADGHVVIELPFDSGFGAKSNRGTAACQRPYVLIGSDDFDFRPPHVRVGVEKLVAVLEGDPGVAIASGRVNGMRYEGWLLDEGNRVVERYIEGTDPARVVNGVGYRLCNLTVNYSLIRSEILGPRKIHWDDEAKIGAGEHGAFFVDVMRAGHGVAWVPGVNITEQAPKPVDRRYASFRGRATAPGRPCFARRGIHEYVLFSGAVEKA